MGSDLAEDGGFLRAIIIRITTFFRGEVKLVVPCCKTLQHVKDLCGMKEILVGTIRGYVVPSFSLLRC
jgi:hypothetical protein